jgi:peptide/nickel transport system substrate-binding protein
MNELKRGIGRKVLYTSMVGAMMLSIMPATFAARPAAAAQTCRNINKIDVCGRFLEQWNKPGSEANNTYVNGLPITAQRKEISLTDGKTYDTQWFERARYEAHPENKAPYDVLLGLLGITLTEGRGVVDPGTKQVRNPADAAFVGIPKPADVSATKAYFDPENDGSGHVVAGKILEYWNKFGGLQQFGYPVSEQFKEISTDGKTYDVQYFERNRFELHPEKAAPYDVELGLLGVQQYKIQAQDASTLPFAPPANQASTRTEIKIGSSQEPDDLTFANNALVASRFRSLIEDQLTGRDDKENVYAQDAWYVPTLENGGARFLGLGDDRYLQVKYKIRRGIKWSDGKELTSNDAVFAYKLYMNPDAPVVSRAEFQKLENVDNPDKYTVIYNYRSTKQAAAFLATLTPGDRPNYSFIEIFATQKKPVISITYSEIGTIYPEHVLGKIPPAKIPESDVARAPIGTGPYKVDHWTTGQEIVLVPNTNYTLTAPPIIKKITAKFITDVNQLLAQIQTGDIDYITSEAFVVPPANSADLVAKGLSVVNQPAATWEHIDFYWEYGPFKEKAVREAIITGINRKRIVDTVYRGAGAVMNGPTPPGVYLSLENPDFAKNYPDVAAKFKLPVYAYDAEKAKSLLQNAGWVAGADGIRAKGGVKLSFEYATTINAVRQQIQALVVADLKAIGVDAVQKAYPSGEFFGQDSPRALGITKFGQFAWVGSRDSDFGVWRCGEVYNLQTHSGQNEQRYCNPKLDDLDAIYNSEIDPKVQVPAAAEAQVVLMTDIAIVPVVQRANIEVVSGKLVNHKETNSQVTSFWNARQWYFK